MRKIHSAPAGGRISNQIIKTAVKVVKGNIMKLRIEEIHESLVNGQRKQMVNQINEYGLYDFWDNYKNYLKDLYTGDSILDYFTDATISYHRITNR